MKVSSKFRLTDVFSTHSPTFVKHINMQTCTHKQEKTFAQTQSYRTIHVYAHKIYKHKHSQCFTVEQRTQ